MPEPTHAPQNATSNAATKPRDAAEPRGSKPQSPVPGGEPRLPAPAGFVPMPNTVFSSADAEAVVHELLAQGVTDLNAITNEVFWRSRDDLRSQKLGKGSPEAQEWLDFRDYAVKPVVDAHAPQECRMDEVAGSGAEVPAADPTGGAAEAPGTTGPAPKVESKGAAGQNPYYNQNDNTFEDAVGGTWLNGSAGMNTCNMTSLTMALVGMAGDEAIVKEKLAAYLRTITLRDGSRAKIAGKWHPMEDILKDPKLLNAVQVEDLVTAAGVQQTVGTEGKKGYKAGYSAVTTPSAILAVAKKSGLVAKGSAFKDSEDDLSKPEVREKVKAMLAAGQKIVGGTVNHYVYITEVRDDGVVVHDPAGARVAISGKPQYMHPGEAGSKLSTWVSGVKDTGRRAAFETRAKGNPELERLVTMAIAVQDAEGKEAKDAAKKALKAAFPGYVNTGANNFYAIDEMTKFNLRARVALTAKPSAAKPETDTDSD